MQSLGEAKVVLTSVLGQRGVRARFDLSAPPPQIRYAPIEEADLERLRGFSAAFIAAFSKYTPTWIAQTRLKTYYFVKRLEVSGQARAATQLPDGVAYDVNALDGCTPFVEEVIHHEFFHFADQTFFGSVYHLDAAWSALNPSGFAYGRGGWQAYSQPGFNNLVHAEPGFIDQYSKLALEEDRAQVFGYLMTPIYRKEAQRWAAEDPILSAKFDLIRQLVLDKAPDMPVGW